MARTNVAEEIRNEDLALVNGLASDAPPFLQDADDLTDEERAYLEADQRGEQGEPDGPSETHEAETASETEAGVLKKGEGDDPAKKPDEKPEAETGASKETDDAETEKVINHGAFHKERERRKSVEKELTDLREKFARGDERLKLMQELQAKAEKPAESEKVDEDPEPDPEGDVFEYIKWQQRENARLREANVKTTETFEENRQRADAATEQTQMVQSYQRAAQEYAQNAPEFLAAYQHLLASRDRELQALGYGDENERRQILHQDEMTIARHALANGKNPAEIMHGLAKERGFAPQAPESDPEPTKTEAEPAKMDDTAAKAEKSEADKLAELKTAQEASMSLSSAGGAGVREMSMEALADMSETEFAEFMAEHPKEVERILGK